MGSTRFILVASLFILNFTCATSYGQSYLEVTRDLPVSPNPKDDPAIAQSVARVLDPIVKSFAKRRDATGVSVAVSHNGKLIYARAVGYSNLRELKPATPETLFSIASVSKPVTAIAILQLVQKRKLGLDDKFVDVLGLELEPKRGKSIDPRIKQVTIRHLLNHTGGWDRNISPSPTRHSNREAVCKHLGIEKSDFKAMHLIEFMLEEPLDFEPGTRHAYSNFGYCILGRVVEAASKRPYGEYVQEEILKPAGISRMVLRSDQIRDDEARSYKRVSENGEVVPGRFSECDLREWPASMPDSYGGWIAAPVDLLRLLNAFDPNSRSKLLSKNAIQAMYSPPRGLSLVDETGKPLKNYYAFGWVVWPKKVGLSAGHGGSGCGTVAYAYRRSSGFNWVTLMNTDAGGPPSSVLSDECEAALAKIKIPPRFDLFRISYPAARR